jgi:hypothetical protein
MEDHAHSENAVLIGQQHPASAALMKITRRALLALEMKEIRDIRASPLDRQRRVGWKSRVRHQF